MEVDKKIEIPHKAEEQKPTKSIVQLNEEDLSTRPEQIENFKPSESIKPAVQN
jgi:ssDNA-binding replication factor A large subunit